MIKHGQVFAGERIDMDNFDPTGGPSAARRAENVASDPYAAAQFFKTVIDLLLNKVLASSKRRAAAHCIYTC